MSVTIKDVARAAGVSVATVSRVLNGSCNVSEASARRVNDAILQLHYSPNFLGRNLRKKETHVILCIMPTSEHSLYSKIVNGMQSYASKVDYDIITATSMGTSYVEIRQMNMLFNRTVDGVVLLGTSFSAEDLNELSENYNVALCCEGIEGANVLTVSVDDEKAAFDAVTALINMGHRRIGFIGTHSKAFSSTARESGYKSALSSAGIDFDEHLVYKDTYDYPCGAAALDKFMELEDKPTAIFAVSDLLAISAINQAISKGIRVGDELAVMGFDNISICDMMIPSVSTVEQRCAEMGELVVKKLISNINSAEKDNKYYTVDHHIILRDSTGKKN